MSKFEGWFLAHEFRTYNLEYIQIVKQGVKTVELWEDGVSSISKNRQREDKIYFRCKKVRKVCTVQYIHIQYMYMYIIILLLYWEKKCTRIVRVCNMYVYHMIYDMNKHMSILRTFSYINRVFCTFLFNLSYSLFSHFFLSLVSKFFFFSIDYIQIDVTRNHYNLFIIHA